MPYNWSWYDEDHTIIRIDIYGDVTWEAYYAVHEQLYTELEHVSHRIDLIFCDQAGMPKGPALRHLKIVISKLVSYKNLGMIYTVSSEDLSLHVRGMIDAAIRVYHLSRFHDGGFVESIDEAMLLIERDRAKQT